MSRVYMVKLVWRRWQSAVMCVAGVSALCFSAVAPVSADYAAKAEAEGFIVEMVEQHGFEAAELKRIFASAEKKDSILKAISRPAEKRLEWAGYRKIFLTEDRIKKGRAFMQQYQATLAAASDKYGVPAHIITAIIGVETRYGQHKGGYRVIDALSTLGFDYPPRSKFFRSELAQFLLLAREQGFDPLELSGSYAGAMGYGQFIPSSYRHYAVDFDGDGVANILTNPVDAIGSVANYFAKHKWKSNEPVAFRTQVEGAQYETLITKSLKPAHRLDELKAQKVDIPAEHDLSQKAKLLKLNGDKGEEFWVALHNFYVITRYNHSHLYALAVHQLANEINQAP